MVERYEEETESCYVLLLRVLNGFTELAAPFQVAKLCRELLGAPLDRRSRFDLQIAIAQDDDTSPHRGLIELTRDLAETFKRGIAETSQFDDIVDRVECLSFDPAAPYIADALELRWRI